MEILLALLNQIPTLVGVGALVSFLINTGKSFGWVTDATAQSWIAAANLVLLIGLFVGSFVGLTPADLAHYDGIAGTIAQLGAFVLALLLQIFASKATHTAFRGVPVVGKSFSLDAEVKQDSKDQ